MAGIIKIGQMDNTIDHTLESANRVYGVGGGAARLYQRVVAETFSQRL